MRLAGIMDLVLQRNSAKFAQFLSPGNLRETGLA